MINCGEREPQLLGHPCQEWSFCQTEAGLGREEVAHGSSMMQMLTVLSKSQYIFFLNKCFFICYVNIGQCLETF